MSVLRGLKTVGTLALVAGVGVAASQAAVAQQTCDASCAGAERVTWCV